MARQSKSRLTKLESRQPPNADTAPREIQLVGVTREGRETLHRTIPIKRANDANK